MNKFYSWINLITFFKTLNSSLRLFILRYCLYSFLLFFCICWNNSHHEITFPKLAQQIHRKWCSAVYHFILSLSCTHSVPTFTAVQYNRWVSNVAVKNQIDWWQDGRRTVDWFPHNMSLCSCSLNWYTCRSFNYSSHKSRSWWLPLEFWAM